MANIRRLPTPGRGCTPHGVAHPSHEFDAFHLAFGLATHNAVPTGLPEHPDNGDEARYTDKSGTYSKCLAQIAPGLVNLDVFAKFRSAYSAKGNGNLQEFGTLIGTPGGVKLNGPQAALDLSVAGADARSFVSPPPFSVRSREYAIELVELYWASLLRDIPFTAYDGNATAIAAAKELDSFGALYKGPRDAAGHVTTKTLFRGGFTVGATSYFAGELAGPYLSQLCLQPTTLGAQPIDQKTITYAPGIDFMTDLPEWQNIQNGASPNAQVTPDPVRRYLRDGRALGAYTRVDQLYQAYLIAYLTLTTLGVGSNPASPYSAYTNEKPFGTFGAPDVAATLAAVSRDAINAVWYQKWIVHLRHRPESGGGIVHILKTGAGPILQTASGAESLDSAILDSIALEQSYVHNGSYLLSQAFPEGSPSHPAYPTGHGTVAGACITVLKFFLNCDQPFASLGQAVVQPSLDGLTLEPYAGTDASDMTVNGELHKLAHNISFGHGIHPGIHWRGDTDWSIILGEQVAIKFLENQVYGYNEKVSVTFRKLDGTSITLSN
ncbi:MAG: hypothetical protein ABSF50_19590 [Burkholderiaceae bacterium]